LFSKALKSGLQKIQQLQGPAFCQPFFDGREMALKADDKSWRYCFAINLCY